MINTNKLKKKLPTCSFFLMATKKQLVQLYFLLAISNVFGQFTGDSLVNSWHRYATDADLINYFKLTHNNFVFLGTAPGERWSKDEFYAFSKPYFDAGKAWDFKPSNREWNFSSDSTFAWFDEDLDTWMRGCRGSGILVFQDNQWKIIYYNLTVLIENEKIQPFIQLRDKKD